MRFRVGVLLLASGCVSPRFEMAAETPQFSTSATSPGLRTLYAMTPHVVPVTAASPFNGVLQAAVAMGFEPQIADALSGLLRVARAQRDDAETELDPYGQVHVRRMTITVAIDRVSATLSPRVDACVGSTCTAFDGLIESEAAVLRHLMNVINPINVAPASNNATSL